MNKLTPPYYAVIFTSTLSKNTDGYNAMAVAMEELARQQPGFLGFKSVRQGLGITISYWNTQEAIVQWKANAEHKVAQLKGKTDWYADYEVEICKVERAY